MGVNVTPSLYQVFSTCAFFAAKVKKMKNHEKTLLVAASTFSLLAIDHTLGYQWTYRSLDKWSYLFLRKKIDLEKLSDEDLEKLWEQTPYPEDIFHRVKLKLPQNPKKKKEKLDTLRSNANKDLMQLDWELSYFDIIRSKEKTLIFLSVFLPVLALLSEPPPLIKACIGDLKSKTTNYLKFSLFSSIGQHVIHATIKFLSRVEGLSPYFRWLSHSKKSLFIYLNHPLEKLSKNDQKLLLYGLQLLSSLGLFYLFFYYRDDDLKGLEHLSALKTRDFSPTLKEQVIKEFDEEDISKLETFCDSDEYQLTYLSASCPDYTLAFFDYLDKKYQVKDALEAKEERKGFFLTMENFDIAKKQAYLDALLGDLEYYKQQQIFLALDEREFSLYYEDPFFQDVFQTIFDGMNNGSYKNLKIFVINPTVEKGVFFSSLRSHEIKLKRPEKNFPPPYLLSDVLFLDDEDKNKLKEFFQESEKKGLTDKATLKIFLKKLKEHEIQLKKSGYLYDGDFHRLKKNWEKLKQKRKKMEKITKKLSLEMVGITLDSDSEATYISQKKLTKKTEYEKLITRQRVLKEYLLPVAMKLEKKAKAELKASFSESIKFIDYLKD